MMRPEHLKEFAERWPTWFDFNGDITRTAMPNGFYCIGEGWRQILWDLCVELEPHVEALHRELATHFAGVRHSSSAEWAFSVQVAVPMRLPDAGRLPGSNLPHAGLGIVSGMPTYRELSCWDSSRNVKLGYLICLLPQNSFSIVKPDERTLCSTAMRHLWHRLVELGQRRKTRSSCR